MGKWLWGSDDDGDGGSCDGGVVVDLSRLVAVVLKVKLDPFKIKLER